MRPLRVPTAEEAKKFEFDEDQLAAYKQYVIAQSQQVARHACPGRHHRRHRLSARRGGAGDRARERPRCAKLPGRLFPARPAPASPALSAPTAVPGFLGLAGFASPLECELYLWPGQRSYTGQPLAEVHTLGSPPLLEAVVRAICAGGARPAESGEFTLRAFLAGRIDLTQAEAVLGVIDATAPAELDAALEQLAGGLARPLRLLRDDLLELLAHLEAGLDFADEDLPFITAEELQNTLTRRPPTSVNSSSGLPSAARRPCGSAWRSVGGRTSAKAVSSMPWPAATRQRLSPTSPARPAIISPRTSTSTASSAS